MTVATIESAASITTQLLGIGALAVVPAAVAAFAYRAAAEERIPAWLAVAAGIAVAALYLGTTPALAVLLDETDPSQLSSALFDVGALVLAVGGAALGREVGDRFSAEVLAWQPTHETGEGVSQLAQAVGQVTTVSLPDTIEDAPGYDPVPRRTKTDLAGARFVFPRGLTVADLEERTAEQLRSDYGIGVTDIQFDEYGDIESLAVGKRAAGIGATLPPATNAVAVRADPGFSASTGDVVQVWEPDSMQRLCTGELRGVAGDVATIAIDATDTPKVDPTRRYRLVTLPVDDRPDREFASLLRAAEETFSTATVEAGSPLHGQPVGALDLTLIAIRPEAGDPVPFPDSEYRLAPGDLLFVVATPAHLRRLEAGATALDPTIASTPSLSSDDAEPDEGIQTTEPTATAREEPTGTDGLPAGEPDEQAEASTADQPAANAGSESFEEIKTNFEESNQPAADEAEPEPTEAATNGDSASFDELKSEFESGDADWEDAPESDTDTAKSEPEFPESDDIDIAFADDEETSESDDSEDAGDGLVSLEEADVSFGDDDDDADDSDGFGDIDIDDDLQGEADDDLSDNIGDLEFEDNTEDVSELDLSDDEGPFAVDEESDDDEDEAESDDDDDDSGGGGSSFAQLKEEFESGEADWEDDVSDSPGGDMRLDE